MSPPAPLAGAAEGERLLSKNPKNQPQRVCVCRCVLTCAHFTFSVLSVSKIDEVPVFEMSTGGYFQTRVKLTLVVS